MASTVIKFLRDRKSRLTIIMLAAWLPAFYSIYSKYHEMNLITGLLEPVGIVVAVLVSVILFIIENNSYKRNIGGRPLFVLSLAILCSLSMITGKHVLNRHDRSPIAIKAVLSKGKLFSLSTIELREDKSFKYSSDRSFFRTLFYRGTYTQRDSILLLSDTHFDEHLISTRLLIRPGVDIQTHKLHTNGIIEMLLSKRKITDTIPTVTLYQVDDFNRTLDAADSFRVLY